MKLLYESLHNHTKLSDGVLSHLELLDVAEKAGFGVIGFTDHDLLPSKEILNELKQYKGKVKWFIGCELSAALPEELGGGESSNFHIVGLFTDPFNKDILNHCAKMQESRIERMKMIVKNLTGLGFKITVEDCFEEAGDLNVGRPHIVRVLNRYKENGAVQDRLMRRMEEVAKTDSAVAENYVNMIKLGEISYPYGLYLSNDAFISDVYVDHLYYKDMDAIVDLIHGAGGVALLAHWHTIQKKIDESTLRKFLSDKRLDGIEVAAIGHVHHDLAQTLHFRRKPFSIKESRHIRQPHFLDKPPILYIRNLHSPRRSIHRQPPRFPRGDQAVLDPHRDRPDQPMPAHGQAAGGFDEQHANVAILTRRGIQDRPRHHVMPPRLVHQPGPYPVVILQEMRPAFQHRGTLQPGTAARNQPHRVAASVPVEAGERIYSHVRTFAARKRSGLAGAKRRLEGPPRSFQSRCFVSGQGGRGRMHIQHAVRPWPARSQADCRAATAGSPSTACRLQS